MKNVYTLLSRGSLVLFFLLFIQQVYAQSTRNGAIDLSQEQADYVLINDKDSNKPLGIESSPFTVELWVQLKENSNNDMNLFRFYSNNNQLSLSYDGDNSFKLATDGNVGDVYWTLDGFTQSTTFLDNWVHVALTYNGSSTVRLYINGSQVYGANLYKNGSPISALYPKPSNHNGDGNCRFGDDDADGKNSGKFYAAEMRVWKVAVSSTNIKKYYDEEVNGSHPNWSNLVRYYHGTHENVSNGKVSIPDVTGNYDATVNNNTRVRVKDYYPPIKPPSFSAFNPNISASTCQSDRINVSWNDIESSSYSYETGNNVWYEVVRTDNTSSVLYSGTGTSYTDTNVSKGDVKKYRFRTFWEINGTRYYSDDTDTSNSGNVKMSYDAATNVTATESNCDRTIDISWSSSETPPKWTIQRATNSSFTSNKVTLSSNISGGTTSYTDNTASIDKDYYYRVIASGTDDNGCTVAGTYSGVDKGRTSQAPQAPTNLALSQDLGSKTLTLTWSNPSGNNATGYKIIREKFDGTDRVEIDINDIGTTSYMDNSLELCVTYRYTVAATNSCATDGVESSTSVTGNISQDLTSFIESVTTSKGYFSDFVRVEWELNGTLNQVDRFLIYRSIAGEGTYSLIKVVDNDLIFEDESAVGGVFYNYKVVGQSLCEDIEIYSNEESDLGFVIPFGVANGHVEYAGGNPVEGVLVNFEKTSGNTGNSIYFDGDADYVDAGDEIDLSNTSFTVEFWEKSEPSSGTRQIFTWGRGDVKNRKLMIGYNNSDKFYFGFYSNNFATSDAYEYDGEWHHWACVYDKDDTSGKNRYIYRDGELVASNYSSSDLLDASLYSTVILGHSNSKDDNYFQGFLDEVRVWKVARSAEEIQENYNRSLNNNITGMVAYWRCDEGFGDAIYDASKTGDTFNKNDGAFNGQVTFSSEIPTSNQLGIRATTDELGDYTIDYIPYASGGQVFRVTPSLGQHQFQPLSRTLYIGDGAKTHNGIDFTDISFFTVSGKVKYENTEVPVEDVTLLIDGVEAIGDDNKVIRTDAEGNYEISVPIGKHYISVEKDGHVFAEGYFPQRDDLGAIEKHEFVEDLTVNFTDSTKVKVAGRVVGGTVQGEKTIGLGLSLNNIGVADLQFKLQKEGYDIDLSDNEIYDLIDLKTDPYTGEYEIEMLPEQWIVKKVGNDNYFIPSGNLSVLDLRNSIYLETVTDSVMVDDEKVEASYSYHHLLNYIIREVPTVEVYSSDDTEFSGDSVFVFTNQVTQMPDTLVIDKTMLNFPIFQMPKMYGVNIYVNEVYLNPDHPLDPVVDKVPVKGAEVTINDQLMINPAATTGKTDASGLLYYEFRAGVPNLSQDGENSYTKTFEVNVETSSHSLQWEPEGGAPFRAYVLGELPTAGTDFVTFGPSEVEMVLRDPPGSNSYAYIEKGSTFQKRESWNLYANSTSALDYTSRTGLFVGTGGGLAGPMVLSETFTDSEYGMEIVKEYDFEGNYTKTYTFKERIETSSDPQDVGSDADLYIGEAKNAFVTKSRNLKVMPTDYCEDYGLEHLPIGTTGYSLGIIDGFVFSDDPSSTFFVYSQSHIVNNLIPNLIEIKDLLLTTSPKYESHLDITSPYFGLSNNDSTLNELRDSVRLANPGADVSNLSYTFTPDSPSETDSVQFINTQITKWINAIITNESEKATAETIRNISIDGSSGALTNEVEETFSSEFNQRSSRDITFTWNSEFQSITNLNGFNLHNTWDMTARIATEEDKTVDNSVLFGYVIDERDEGDYYSIDVKYNKGVALMDRSKFTDFITDKESFLEENGTLLGIAGGAIVGKAVLGKVAEKALKVSTTRGNALVAAGKFGLDFGYQLLEMSFMGYNSLNLFDDISGNQTYDITGFNISSPIFSTRGGQSKCPYEGELYTSFYHENNQVVKLNTATLKRENPKLDVTPAIRANVPESEVATYTLALQNESESNTDMWYEISIDESTNPYGAVLLMDGLTAERSYLVPAFQTVNKTLTLAKGRADIMDYDSIAVVLQSTCQNDPTSDNVEVISDTVFISAHFLPECATVDITNMDDNWVVNYNNDNQVPITLGGYDINLSTLERIDVQYKSLSGSPVVIKTYFKDDQTDAYDAYNGEKEYLNGRGDVSFNWDISALTDRVYQLRARAHCTDGSIYEMDYIQGTIDRVTPTVFGTPLPTDGILNYGDNIGIQFNEELEAGLIKDHNITVRAALNGADVSHQTSVSLDGANDYLRSSAISLNNKAWTIEYWMKRNSGTSGVILTKGNGSEQIQLEMEADETMSLTLGSQTITVNPQSYYSDTYPVDSWHHWAITYDPLSGYATVYMDDKVIEETPNINFVSSDISPLYVGAGNNGTSDHLQANLHEIRIWEKARTLGELVANMNITLRGATPYLYAYWPVNEADGTLLTDITASRTMQMMGGTWDLAPGSYAYAFNGSSEYLSIDGANIVLEEESDFTIEFWWNAATPMDTVTFFSSGRGDGVEIYKDPSLGLAISGLSDGTMAILSNGNTYKATTKNYFDQEWHHFAFTVNRKGNAKVFVDGELQSQTTMSTIAGLAGSKMWIGARGVDENPSSTLIDQYFNGKIDEFRIWNTERKQTHLNLYKHHKLQGDEVGLIAYYPFETYTTVMGATLMEESLVDQTAADNGGSMAIATSISSAFTTEGAAIQDVRPVQDIPFSYVVNNDRIIIVPDVDAARIEGQLMEVTVSNVQDLYGNRLLSPVSWTVLAEQNILTWEEQVINLEMQEGEGLTFEAVMINSSNEGYDYQLDNLPGWLSTDDAYGTVAANSRKVITFRISEGVNVGTYEQGINLTTVLGFDEKLSVSLRVFRATPVWEVDPTDYQYTMNLIGQVTINEVISSDPYDIVGVFVGEECRGVANLAYVAPLGTYQVFLNIYSNEIQNEEMTFKVWDASTGNIHEDVTPLITFTANTIQGTNDNPVQIVASNSITANYQLSSGWTWISFNLNSPLNSNPNALLAGVGAEGDVIKGQTYYDQYSELTGWVGTLTSSGGVTGEEMYKVNLTYDTDFSVTGAPMTASSMPIALDSGWNYLGFIPQVSMTVAEALNGISPIEGDLIKSQNAFSLYNPLYGWVGSLQTLTPREGYMLYTGKEATLTYPEKSILSNSRLASLPSVNSAPWAYNAQQYKDNMSVVVQLTAEEESIEEGWILAAFEGAQCRGITSGQQIGEETYFFLTVGGNTASSALQFKAYDPATGYSYELNSELSAYTQNQHLGDLEYPIEMRLATELSAEDGFQVYPNPFTSTLQLLAHTEAEGKATIKLTSITGNVLYQTQTDISSSGQVKWSHPTLGNNLPTGTYLLMVITEQNVEVLKVIKQ
ncbi:LamG-like jellyroll fold domain-containing protein [Limibacter armeniacum]|uniref:LamG-like jellyroll fold domain-containing protein n=1 Tax=Limibacter armeniacum TaxID=466084 RepID=UPI002FE5F33E